MNAANKAGTGAATDRLPRLLALVPYLIARPGIPVDEAAADFGVTPKQLRKDLELLWMCGLPGYGPGDLIDLSFEGDTITVTYDAGMRRPLRLTAAEATALLVALRALADTPGVVDTDAVRRSLAKIESAVGQAQPAGVVVGLAMRESEATERTRAGRAGRRAVAQPRPAHPLLHGIQGRDQRPHGGPDADAAGRGPRLPGGVVPAGRGRAAVPP